MRVAALYDVHGNLPALDAVLADADAAGADVLLVGGDVGSGPMFIETLERLRGLAPRARFIRGNGERELVAAFDDPAAAADDDLWRRRTAWDAARMTPGQRDAIAAWPEQLVLEVDVLGSVRFCHGSP